MSPADYICLCIILIQVTFHSGEASIIETKPRYCIVKNDICLVSSAVDRLVGCLQFLGWWSALKYFPGGKPVKGSSKKVQYLVSKKSKAHT